MKNRAKTQLAELKAQAHTDSAQLQDQIDQATKFRRELIRVNDLYFEALDDNKRLQDEVSSLRSALAKVLRDSGRMEEASRVLGSGYKVSDAETEMRKALSQVQKVLKGGRSSGRGRRPSGTKVRCCCEHC